jgi:hypothetical protein
MSDIDGDDPAAVNPAILALDNGEPGGGLAGDWVPHDPRDPADIPEEEEAEEAQWVAERVAHWNARREANAAAWDAAAAKKTGEYQFAQEDHPINLDAARRRLLGLRDLVLAAGGISDTVAQAVYAEGVSVETATALAISYGCEEKQARGAFERAAERDDGLGRGVVLSKDAFAAWGNPGPRLTAPEGSRFTPRDPRDPADMPEIEFWDTATKLLPKSPEGYVGVFYGVSGDHKTNTALSVLGAVSPSPGQPRRS